MVGRAVPDAALSVRANFMHHVVPNLEKKNREKRKGDKTVVPTSRYDFIKSGLRPTVPGAFLRTNFFCFWAIGARKKLAVRFLTRKKCERRCKEPLCGQNGPSGLQKTLRRRSHSYALAPRATASTGARRSLSPSPILAFRPSDSCVKAEANGFSHRNQKAQLAVLFE